MNWTFGLAVQLAWWQWYLMLLGGAFCAGLGWALGLHAAARVVAR